MNTTNLFVELIVIGIGAAIWVFCFLATAFGYDWINHGLFASTLGVGFVIGVVYVLGIVTDRIADGLFEASVSKYYRRKIYSSDTERFYADRTLLLLQHSPCSELFEYGRSRMRICRGWALNSVLTTIAFNALVWTRPFPGTGSSRAALVASSAFLLMSVGACYAWCQLKRTEYIKTKETAEFLRAQKPDKSTE
jgi:hypothetical protein